MAIMEAQRWHAYTYNVLWTNCGDCVRSSLSWAGLTIEDGTATPVSLFERNKKYADEMYYWNEVFKCLPKPAKYCSSEEIIASLRNDE
jgi:hypothetical protein